MGSVERRYVIATNVMEEGERLNRSYSTIEVDSEIEMKEASRVFDTSIVNIQIQSLQEGREALIGEVILAYAIVYDGGDSVEVDDTSVERIEVL